MSLTGLFALFAAQAESLQIASSPSQEEGESLPGPQFLNELAAFLEQGSHQGDYTSGQQVIGQGSSGSPGGESPKDATEKAQIPAAQPPAPQASTKPGQVVKTIAEALNDDPKGKASSGHESTRSANLSASIGTLVTSQASTRPAAQGAVSASMGEAVQGAHAEGERTPGPASGSKVPLPGVKAGAASIWDPMQAGVKAGPPPAGHVAENFSPPEAQSGSSDAERNGPHDLQRLIQGVQRQSVPTQAALRSGAHLGLGFQPAQRSVAETPPGPDNQPSSADIRSTAERAPETERGTSSQQGSDSDSSSQRQAAFRPGAASAGPGSSLQAALSGVRFADFMQAQATPVQPGLPASEGQAAKAMPPVPGDNVLAEAATVRGQDADQVFSQIVQNARLLRGQSETRFEVRLKPEFLGRIQIQTLMSADQKMTARFLVEDPEVRALLESRLPLLAERLGESGLRIAGMEVQPMNSQSGGDASRFAQEPGGQSRQQQSPSGRAGSDSSPSDGDPESPKSPRQSVARPGGIHLVA